VSFGAEFFSRYFGRRGSSLFLVRGRDEIAKQTNGMEYKNYNGKIK